MISFLFFVLWPLFWFVATTVGALSVATYGVHFVVVNFVLREQNLKRKYDAQWALVTGASSGIGLAIVKKLAAQGLNVVLVALDDDVFKSAASALRSQFPALEFRVVGVNLGQKGYMEPILKATADIAVQLIFNNAGFMTTGFFHELPLARLEANFECNAACQVPITHHFLGRLVAEKKRGAVFFTSSPANAFANPTSALYGSTKAFVTEFAASIAPEVAEYGIDVLAVHPSPTNTSFYQHAHNIDTINLFKRTAITPDVVASYYFSSVGRVVVADQGWFCIAAQLLVKTASFNPLADIMKFVMPTLPDYQLLKAKNAPKKTN